MIDKNVYYKSSILFIKRIRDFIIIKKAFIVRSNLNIVLREFIFA